MRRWTSSSNHGAHDAAKRPPPASRSAASRCSTTTARGEAVRVGQQAAHELGADRVRRVGDRRRKRSAGNGHAQRVAAGRRTRRPRPARGCAGGAPSAGPARPRAPRVRARARVGVRATEVERGRRRPGKRQCGRTSVSILKVRGCVETILSRRKGTTRRSPSGRIVRNRTGRLAAVTSSTTTAPAATIANTSSQATRMPVSITASRIAPSPIPVASATTEPEADRHRRLPQQRPRERRAARAERDQHGQQPAPLAQLLERRQQQAEADQHHHDRRAREHRTAQERELRVGGDPLDRVHGDAADRGRRWRCAPLRRRSGRRARTRTARSGRPPAPRS